MTTFYTQLLFKGKMKSNNSTRFIILNGLCNTYLIQYFITRIIKLLRVNTGSANTIELKNLKKKFLRPLDGFFCRVVALYDAVCSVTTPLISTPLFFAHFLWFPEHIRSVGTHLSPDTSLRSDNFTTKRRKSNYSAGAARGRSGR